jgi:hypothetical protein
LPSFVVPAPSCGIAIVRLTAESFWLTLPTVAPAALCEIAIEQNALATRTSTLRITIFASISSFD